MRIINDLFACRREAEEDCEADIEDVGRERARYRRDCRSILLTKGMSTKKIDNIQDLNKKKKEQTKDKR